MYKHVSFTRKMAPRCQKSHRGPAFIYVNVIIEDIRTTGRNNCIEGYFIYFLQLTEKLTTRENEHWQAAKTHRGISSIFFLFHSYMARRQPHPRGEELHPGWKQ